MRDVSKLIENGGVLPQSFDDRISYQNNFVSIRKKGLKLGGKLILSGMVLVPLLGILSEMLSFNPVIVGLTAVICFWGGILRMIYALIFEGDETKTLEQKIVKFCRNTFRKQKNYNELPPQSAFDSFDARSKQGIWRETSDLDQINGAFNNESY